MDIKTFKTEEEYISQMTRGVMLNPRVDSTFKALFTRQTKESRGALKSFLEAAIERTIKHFELRPNDIPVEFDGQRKVSYDIVCEFNDGLSADIEMQAFNQSYDYGKRAEYQVARLETTYLSKGSDWTDAPKVYQITVLDFVYMPKTVAKSKLANSTPLVSRYTMRTKDGRELSNTLNVIFIELPKAVALENSIRQNKAIENWAIFLKEADNPKKKDIIEQLVQKEEGLMEAQQALSSISNDRDLWLQQYHQELWEHDEISRKKAAERSKRLALERGMKRGLRNGLKQGMKQGIQQGILIGKQETARKLLAKNLSMEDIAEVTGLSTDEIKEIAKN